MRRPRDVVAVERVAPQVPQPEPIEQRPLGIRGKTKVGADRLFHLFKFIRWIDAHRDDSDARVLERLDLFL